MLGATPDRRARRGRRRRNGWSTKPFTGRSTPGLGATYCPPLFPGKGEGPIPRSHALSAGVLSRAAEAIRVGKQVDFQGALLPVPELWWESSEFRYEEASLTRGFGAGMYLIYMLPSVRLAFVAIGRALRLVDPPSVFMQSRYRVAAELESLDRRFSDRETRVDQLEAQLLPIQNLRSSLPPPERLDQHAGNLLLRLGRLGEAEAVLRCSIDRPLCSGTTRAMALYDLACIAARTGRPVLCRDRLQEAIGLLPRLREGLDTDTDLDLVRQARWFQEFSATPPTQA
jgi:hypothetical protein